MRVGRVASSAMGANVFQTGMNAGKSVLPGCAPAAEILKVALQWPAAVLKIGRIPASNPDIADARSGTADSWRKTWRTNIQKQGHAHF